MSADNYIVVNDVKVDTEELVRQGWTPPKPKVDWRDAFAAGYITEDGGCEVALRKSSAFPEMLYIEATGSSNSNITSSKDAFELARLFTRVARAMKKEGL